jgi:hypothetical protein
MSLYVSNYYLSVTDDRHLLEALLCVKGHNSIYKSTIPYFMHMNPESSSCFVQMSSKSNKKCKCHIDERSDTVEICG